MAKQIFVSYPIPSDFSWECPECGMKHSGPHYAHKGQIDFDKKPNEWGRVKFNRRRKDDTLDANTSIVSDLPDEADAFEEEGFLKPLFCPHCGWIDDWIIIKRIGEMITPDKVEGFLTSLPKGNYTRRELLERFWNWLKGENK